MPASSRTLSLGVLLVAFVAVNTITAQPGTANIRTFLGRWQLNAARSDVKSSRLVVTKAASGDMTVTLQGLTQTMRLDGKERPSVAGSTAIWTETGPRSWRTVYRLASVDNNIDQYTLSADGRTLTLKTEFLVPKRSEQTATFSRQSGGPGLLGVWKMEALQNDANEFELSSTDGAHVTITWPAAGGTALAPTDGSEVAMTGPPTAVAPGTRVSFKLTGTNTFDIVLKMNGEVISTGHFTLSADAKTLTMDAISGPTAAGGDRATLVYERR